MREERERIGLSQPQFAAVAGTTKQTVFAWETNKTAPDAVQLSAFADAGADVLYIVTGDLNTKALSADEQELITAFRAAPLVVKAAVIGALTAGPAPSQKIKQVVKGSANQVAGGNIDNQQGGGNEVQGETKPRGKRKG